MAKKQILICDDDAEFAHSLSQQVNAFFHGQCELTLHHSADSVRFALPEQTPDIALLDIELNTENGIALARELFPAGCGTAVVFITGYVEYCTDVYEAEHIYFLLKPLKQAQLERALTKAINALAVTPSYFSVKINGSIRRIDSTQVRYIESFYRKLQIHLASETIEAYGSIAALPEWLKERMIPCHKSFLVNPSYISSISGNSFLLRDGTEIPISHSNRTESRRRFLEFLTRNLEGSR